MMRGLRMRSIVAACGALWGMAGVLAAEPAAEWPRLPPLPLGPVIILADGGILAGDLLALDEKSVTIASPLCGAVALPRSKVSGFRASQAVPPRATVAPTNAAMVTMTNRDTARVTSLAIGDGMVKFSTAQRPSAVVAMPMARLLAIDFPVQAAPASGPWIALRDGSRLPRGSVPAGCGQDEIVATTADEGDVQFLAALPADAAADRVSMRAWPTVRGMTSFTAIAVHAPARVVYRLAQPARRFTTAVAIADSAGQGGSAVVRIRGRSHDGSLRDIFTSPVIRGGDEPLAIAADLGGATEVELIVDEADVGTVLDRTIWLDPRITW